MRKNYVGSPADPSNCVPRRPKAGRKSEDAGLRSG